MRATIKDLARECNVSTATVSLALSGKKGRVSEKTRELIEETAKRMNYHPNRMAAGLATKSSRTIGIVLNDIRNTHIAELFMALDCIIENRGFSLTCHILNEHVKESDALLVNLIASENVCALIWAKPFEPQKKKENDELYRMVDSLGIPVFTMDSYGFTCPGVNICYDYEQAGYLATKYLIEAGHRRIGCITGDKEFKVTLDRLHGYQRALEESRIPYDKKLIYAGDYTMESGSKALPYLMGQKVTSIFSMNDEMAFGVYQGARNYGIHIPKELSIIGCDNVPFADALEVPLSTIRVPIHEMGVLIGEKICNVVESGQMEERTTVYYKPDLFLRGSVSKVE